MITASFRLTGTLNDGRGGKGVTDAGRLRVVVRGGSAKAASGTSVASLRNVERMSARTLPPGRSSGGAASRATTTTKAKTPW